jgi:hypothetical protein
VETAAPLIATSPLPELKRVLVVKPIDRDVGPPLAPGQVAYLPADHEALKDGRAKDPDAKDEKPPAKAAAKD